MPPVLDTVGAAVGSANNVATPTTLTPVLPAHAAGKLLLAATFCRSGTPTVATPAGWTQLINVVGTNGRIALFGKIAASGSEANPAIVWSGLTTGTSGTPVQAQCAVFTGALETITGITDVLGAVENGAAATATAASGSAITTLAANDLVLSLSCRLDDVGTWTPPAGFTAIGSALTTSGADMSFAWAYLVQATPGSVAPADFGLAGASSFASTGILIALKQHVPVTFYGAVARPITFGATTKPALPTPKMETFQDDFSTAPGAPKWNDGAGFAWIPGDGYLTINCTLAYGYISTWDGVTEGVYDLTGSYIYAKITPPPMGNGTKETYIEVSRMGTSGATRDGVSLFITASSLAAFKKINGVTVVQATPRAYDPVNDQWLRIREQAGTIYCDTSPDGINWTNFWSTAADFNITKCWAAFTSGYYGTEAASTALVDSVNIPQVPAGPTTYYGALTLPVAFNQVVQGRRQTFGQVAALFIFSKEVQGRRKAFGQITAPFVFSKDIQAQRKTFGQLLSPYLFSKDVRGQRKTFGQTALPINVAISTSGFRVGLTQYGIIVLPIGFASATDGRRKTFGQVSLSSVFSKDVQGQRKTFGQISLPIIFTKEAVGREWVYGQLSMQTLFGKEVSGRRKTFGQIVFPLNFTKDLRGSRKTFGQTALPVNFLVFVDGQAFVGPKTYYGQLDSPFVFNKQVSARRQTFGQVISPFLFGSASQGWRHTFGKFEFPIDFDIDTKTGFIEAHGQILLPITIDFEVDGRITRAGIILNDALAIYLGLEPVRAVYTKDQKVWPSN
jgi:hypothetical protein